MNNEQDNTPTDNEDDDSFGKRLDEFNVLIEKSKPKRKFINWIFRNIFNIDTGRACLPWNYKGKYFDIVKGHDVHHEPDDKTS